MATIANLNASRVFDHKDAAALAVIFRQWQTEIRYNERGGFPEVREAGGPWGRRDDAHWCARREQVANQFEYHTSRGSAPLRFGRDAWRDAVLALADAHRVDPFQEWLLALPAWDHTPRLDSWLDVVFTTRPGCQLTAWAARYILLGAVTRTFEPGAKLDVMPVLIGGQGTGKSTILARILPPHMPVLFTDGLFLAGDPKHLAESLQGRVIVEASEMSGANRADLERLKAFLTRTDDGGVRLAYRADPAPMPRRAIIIGSSNDSAPLPNDPSGNRRFCPVHVEAKDIQHLRTWIDANRDQLWAEALHRYQQTGEQARLPEHLFEKQAVAAEDARRSDEVLEDAVARWIHGSGRQRTDGITTEEVAIGIGLVETGVRLSMRDHRRIGAVLRAAEYIMVRVSRPEGRVRKWFAK